ncbi:MULTISPECIES: RIP metalloprotease RseP [Stenotrophomonas]|uniref:RIP metalloprotease RseP n=1 Tax=Stenotrophomonas TaxID=40323 RepID=UPI000C266385|nr:MULTISPECIES: RIP metalloprotease RseP [Stenotrophomonas]MCO7469059.1 RIP metalloprotease RseP [Stenotrophomonas maltophilia]PJL10499.1 RIP metalloprotease RseP [Stenotrophomonas maltophilia]PTS76038.1 RIP metalloprotease RseP [Stenotrophomonas sp. HMWF023]CAH0145734.1 Regulator of sigma-E protease RseP [Stenotrophomonas lactitubi]CAH0185148.1 Regulator of sigma-E protease RseP [Stenotrophomonas lactitubi]
MTDFIGSVWWMIVSLGLLVTFHEFGHYWVGRLCGVKVLRFSVGFGRPLWSRRDRHGTEFAIAAIPLGGYVKFLDEREVEVHPHERGQAFNHKTVWQRIAIVAAGPVANLLLCILLLWAMFVIGKQDYSATVGRATGMAATAGLGSGDRLLSVDGRDVITLGEASMALTAAAMDRRDVTLQVLDPADQLRSRTLPLSQLPAGFDERRVPILAGVYWRAWLQPPLVDNIVKGSAAEGHLQTGDLIVAIDGQRIDSVEQAISEVGSLGRRGGPAMIEVLRGGERLALEITPRQGKDGKGQPTWQIGAGFAKSYSPAYDTLLKFGPLQSVTVAVRETGRMAADSLAMMGRIVTGKASLQNVSGPVTIARVANISAKRGVDWFIQFLALLSLSLCIINLLPIPILDGGHLLYYLIELVKGSPLSERAVAAGQYIGLALLAGLMGLAFYNDILGLVPR